MTDLPGQLNEGTLTDTFLAATCSSAPTRHSNHLCDRGTDHRAERSRLRPQLLVTSLDFQTRAATTGMLPAAGTGQITGYALPGTVIHNSIHDNQHDNREQRPSGQRTLDSTWSNLPVPKQIGIFDPSGVGTNYLPP